VFGGPWMKSRRWLALWLLAVGLQAMAMAGCTPAAVSVRGPQTATNWVGMRALAGKLNLSLRRSNVCIASMADSVNTLLIIGPPHGGAILNGRRHGHYGDTALVEGQLMVSAHLAATLGYNLHPPAVRQRPTKTRNWVNRPVVVLDAGHGGKDPGASRSYAPAEKHLALDTAMRVRNLLLQEDVTVFMTRASDRFVSLDDRVKFANARKANLFVSIHADAAPNPKARGFTVYIARKAGARAVDLARQLIAATKPRAGACRGLKRAGFRVLVGTKMPAALVELGYLTHRDEAAQLTTASYRQRLAEGIAEGIEGHLAAFR